MNRRGFLGFTGTAVAGILLGLWAQADPVAQLTVPITWTASDDKIELIKAMMARALDEHDRLIDAALFAV